MASPPLPSLSVSTEEEGCSVSGRSAQRTVDSLVRPIPFRSWRRLTERTCRSGESASEHTHEGITTVTPSSHPGQPAGRDSPPVEDVAAHGDRRTVGHTAVQLDGELGRGGTTLLELEADADP